MPTVEVCHYYIPFPSRLSGKVKGGGNGCSVISDCHRAAHNLRLPSSYKPHCGTLCEPAAIDLHGNATSITTPVRADREVDAFTGVPCVVDCLKFLLC